MSDGWMTCDFTSFSTVFQSFWDDGRMIIPGLLDMSEWYVFYVGASSQTLKLNINRYCKK